MSTVKTEVTQIGKIRHHPGADKLDIAEIGGWQVIVGRDQYTEGQKVVYFEQGTIIPDDVAEELGVLEYLPHKIDINGRRVHIVHRINLRGEPSFGLVIPAKEGREVGDDVSSFYRTEKYHPPVRLTSGDTEADHGFFPRYVDIENMRTYPNVFEVGEPVIATEKVHGTNSRIGFVKIDGVPVLMAGSRTYRRKRPDNDAEMVANLYWMPHSLPSVQSAIRAVSDPESYWKATSLVIYGEVYGKSIQSYEYGLKGREFRAFDVMVDGVYLDYVEMLNFCVHHEIPIVPLIYSGPFGLDIIRQTSNGLSYVGGKDGREGVVVRPVKERSHPRIGRVILKYVGDEYLFGKKSREETTDA